MSNRDIVKNYNSEGDILPCRLVKFGSNDYGVVQASASSDKIVGVSVPLITVASGDTVDVAQDGIADVQLGGTVTRGDLLTSDANGCAITAAPSAGTNARIIGMAQVSGVANDIIPVLVEIGSFQG